MFIITADNISALSVAKCVRCLPSYIYVFADGACNLYHSFSLLSVIIVVIIVA